MSLTIALTRSAVPDKHPLPTDLEHGELALNFAGSNPFLSVKDTDGTIRRLDRVEVSPVEPLNPTDGQLWYDTNKSPYFLRVRIGSTWVIAGSSNAAGPPLATETTAGLVRLAGPTHISAGTAGHVVDAAQLKTVSDAQAPADWDAPPGSPGAILNKPDIPPEYTLPAATNTLLGGVRVASQQNINVGTSGYVVDAAQLKQVSDRIPPPGEPGAPLVPATPDTLGGVKIGTGINVTADGTISTAAIEGTQTDLYYTPSTRLLESSTGADVVLPIFSPGLAGFAPPSPGGTGDYLRADGAWAPVNVNADWSSITNKPSTFPPPIASSSLLGGVKQGANITIAADGTISSTGSGGATNLDGLTDVTITAPATDQVLRYNGSQWINAASPSGGGGTVTQVTGGSGLTGNVTTSGALAVGQGTGIRVNTDDVAIDRTTVDTWYATAAQGTKADTALQPGSVDLGYTAASRTITNTGGDSAVLPLVTSGAAGLAPQSGGGTTNFLRADGTWATPPVGGGGVSAVTGTAPIASSGGSTPAISISPASGSAAGSMSSADFSKLQGIATGATANSTDAQLRDRSTHTGTQTASTISDFTASSRAQVEATLVAGSNVTLIPAGSGATRTVTIASTAAGGASNLDGLSDVTITTPATDQVLRYNGSQWINAASPSGGGGTVTQVDGGAGLTGSVTTSGSLAVGQGLGITVNANDVAINRATVDGWYATAAQGAKADTALQPGSVDLGYSSATRTISNTGGDGIVLPLVTSGAPGLAPLSGGGTTNFLRADGQWAAPPAGGGGVTQVTGTAPIVSSGGTTPAISIGAATTSAPGSMSAADKTKLDTLTAGANGTVTSVTGGAGLTGAVTTTGALAVGQGTGITVNTDDVAVDRATVDTWYVPRNLSTLPVLP